MSVAKTKQEFDKAVEGLPHLDEMDLEAEVVIIEPVTAAYFHNQSRQRCVIRRKNGDLFVAYYD